MTEAAKRGLLIVISGPSGAGKGTIVEKLMEDGGAALSISCTTRQARPHEKHGESYFFISEAEFEDRIKNKEFLEYANVYGNYYGTPRREVEQKLDKGVNVILEIDVQGAMQVKRNFPGAVMIFIMPPSEQELLNRLRGRGTETEEQIERRVSKAQAEMEMADMYQYKVVNDDLDTAIRQVREIVKSIE